MKLNIENFQSLEGRNELEFKPGITMIVGASNSGKTATLRALRGLVLNYRGNVKKYLTHFKDHLQVEVSFDDSKVYQWSKDSKGKTNYTIITDGQEESFDKAGNNDIFSFDKNFPFVIRDKKLINTYTEKDGLPFPFDLNDVELFKVFEELYNIGSTSTIFKYMKRLETQTNSQLSNTREEIALNKKRIEAIIEVEDRYDLKILENLKNRADAIQAGMLGLDDDIDTARRNNKISKSIKTVLDQKRDFDLEESSKLIEDIKSLQKDIKIVNSNNKIEQINVYKKEFSTAVIESYNALSSDYSKVKSLENSISSLVEEEKDLLEQLEDLKAQLAEIDVCPLCKQPLKGE